MASNGMRFDKERANKMRECNWDFGSSHKNEWKTEHSTLRAPRMVQKLAKTKPNKNYSDSRDIFGDAKISATEHFKTISRADYHKSKSAASSSFARTRPLSGFDRKTANRTNYSLGLGRPTVYKSEIQRQQAPLSQRPPVRAPSYKARRDMGQTFNIITCKDTGPSKRDVPKFYRPSEDRTMSMTTRNTAYNIISGRPEVKKRAPAVPKYSSEKAPLRSLVALRPPTN